MGYKYPILTVGKYFNILNMKVTPVQKPHQEVTVKN